MHKPPHFFQAYPFSCVPACLRMVLASFDYEITEPELRNLCQCDETGTTIANAVKAVIECGFDAYQENLTFDELAELVSQNIFPIVFIKISEAVEYSHAIVVYKISSNKVFALDSDLDDMEREIDSEVFEEIWTRGLTIVVERKR